MEGKFTIDHIVDGLVVSSQEFINPVTTEGVDGVLVTRIEFPESIVLHGDDEVKVSFEPGKTD